MNPVQIHLAINHFSLIGVIFAGICIALGLLQKQTAVIRAGLALVILATIAIVPTYFSGEESEDTVEELQGVQESNIEAHEELAKATAIACVVLSGVAAFALWKSRQCTTICTKPVIAILVGILVVVIMLAQMSHSGGLIRHPELEMKTQAE